MTVDLKILVVIVLVVDAALVEAEADLVAEEAKDQLCIVLFVINVAEIVKFLSDQVVKSQFTAAIVLKKPMAEMVTETITEVLKKEDQEKIISEMKVSEMSLQEMKLLEMKFPIKMILKL
jgi:hypothetical protein